MNPSVDSIPEWNFEGLIPAINSPDPLAASRSPYSASLIDLVVRFGTTEIRRCLLSGLLEYRGDLHNAGIERGFQWIDGSFVQNVEDAESRGPKDIDIVTFLHLPERHTEVTLAASYPQLFNRKRLRETYGIDAYFAVLNPDDLEGVVARAVYWSSLWSRTRGGSWKGYLQVEIAADEDAAAKSELERLAGEGDRS